MGASSAAVTSRPCMLRWVRRHLENNYSGFGTDNSIDLLPNYLFIKHATFPFQQPEPAGDPDALPAIPTRRWSPSITSTCSRRISPPTRPASSMTASRAGACRRWNNEIVAGKTPPAPVDKTRPPGHRRELCGCSHFHGPQTTIILARCLENTPIMSTFHAYDFPTGQSGHPVGISSSARARLQQRITPGVYP